MRRIQNSDTLTQYSIDINSPINPVHSVAVKLNDWLPGRIYRTQTIATSNFYYYFPIIFFLLHQNRGLFRSHIDLCLPFHLSIFIHISLRFLFDFTISFKYAVSSIQCMVISVAIFLPLLYLSIVVFLFFAFIPLQNGWLKRSQFSHENRFVNKNEIEQTNERANEINRKWKTS